MFNNKFVLELSNSAHISKHGSACCEIMCVNILAICIYSYIKSVRLKTLQSWIYSIDFEDYDFSIIYSSNKIGAF
jgi:hypothetical protein